MLVVVLMVVLILVARSWKTVAPEAIDVSNADSPLPFDDYGQTDAGTALRDDSMPGLHEMQDRTDDHARQIGDALDEIE